MATVNFRDRTVKKLKCELPSRQIDYWDASLERFGLVSWTGQKTWTVLCRHHHRSRKMTLGPYPAMALADARDCARKALTAADDGLDPASQKYAATNARTFAELCADYIKRHAIPNKKTWKEDQRILDTDVLPRWKP
jgi:hypothetical protein